MSVAPDPSRLNPQVRPQPRGMRAAAPTVETLEGRRLLSATITTPVANTFVSAGAGPTTIDLGSTFSDPAVALVDMTTTAGPIDLSLDAAAAPKNVANFLRYVNGGLYNGVLIHRAVPGFIVQGGGFLTNGTQYQAFAPVQSEASAATSNVTGTIAMALGASATTGQTDPNSGTDEWFVNLANNNFLDSQGFTAFGTVVNGTLSTVENIDNLPKADAASLSPAFGPDAAANDQIDFPVLQDGDPPSLDPSNLVVVTRATQVPVTFSITATSDNPSLVTPTVSGTSLSLAYPTAGATGVAHVTVTATEANGSSVRQTFLAAVGSTPVGIGTGTPAAKGVVFTDASGKKQQIALTGPGSASVIFSGTGVTTTTNAKTKTVTVSATGGATVAAVSTTGTTARSALKFTTARGSALSVAGLTTDAAIGSITGTGVDLTGPLSAAGVVGKLSLASVNGGSVTLGGTTTRGTTAVTVGGISNAAFTSAVPLASIAVKGSVTGSSFSFTAGGLLDLSKLSITGLLASTTINAAGTLGTVTAASSTGNTIEAGVTLAAGNVIPTTSAEFTSSAAIDAVTFKSDSGTNLAAATLGKLNLGNLTVTNGGTHFGIAAHSITSLTAKSSNGGRLSLKRVSSASTLATQLAKNKVDLTGTDLTIGIL